MSMIIHFLWPDVMKPQPWPIGVDDHGIVTSGLGPDDGASLIGFGPLGEQHVTVLPIAMSEDPSIVVGLVPSFAAADGTGPFEWQHVVAEVLIYQRNPEPIGDPYRDAPKERDDR